MTYLLRQRGFFILIFPTIIHLLVLHKLLLLHLLKHLILLCRIKRGIRTTLITWQLPLHTRRCFQLVLLAKLILLLLLIQVLLKHKLVIHVYLLLLLWWVLVLLLVLGKVVHLVVHSILVLLLEVGWHTTLWELVVNVGHHELHLVLIEWLVLVESRHLRDVV